MSNRKLNLEHESQPENPFRLLFISASKYENDWSSFPHNHPFAELFFVKKGAGRIQIENESIPVAANSLVVIGPQVMHTEFSNPTSPLEYYVLGVEGLKISTESEREYIHVPESSTSVYIGQCFENILREMHNKREGYTQICQYYLAILILYFCRKGNASYQVVETQKNSHECYKVKHFIDHNFRRKITLDLLAQNCNLSKYYLGHRFAELYGQSPIAYLNEVRLAAAKDLLLTTDHSIEEIAISTGFSSASYFSQAFQKKFLTSPQQFRKHPGSGHFQPVRS